MKICNHCKSAKPLEAFGKSSRHSDGHLNRCLECNREMNRGKYNLAGHRRHHVTDEQWLLMSKDGCHICGRAERLTVDHNHSCCPGTYSCGKCVRGVLCHWHNTALGLFREDADELEKALAYLRNSVA